MDIMENPFFILGATTRDDRRRITSLAEEKNLLSEENITVKEDLILTNPRKRLAAEVGWLPGINPKRVVEAITILQNSPEAIRDIESLPSLARANLLAAGLVRAIAIDSINVEKVAKWIVELAETFDDITPGSAMTLINEERTAAGFPAVPDNHTLEFEIEERQKYYLTTIKNALKRLSWVDQVKVITEAVETATGGGKSHAPVLIDKFIDNFFDVDAQRCIAEKTEKIETTIEEIRVAASQKRDETILNQLVSKLELVVRDWDLVAQPIQVSKRSRGQDHTLSYEVAGKIRELAVEVFNEHDHLRISQRLTALIQEVFAEVDQLLESAEEDVAALNEIEEQRVDLQNKIKAHEEQWKREITYQAEWGIIFKNNLKISPNGVEWGGKRIPLSSISRLRWGGTKHSVNGIPQGTTYNISVWTDSNGVDIKIKKEKIYHEFIDRLWKAVGTRLLTQMLDGLRKGHRYRFGNAVVYDCGVELERHHIFRSNERIPCRWTDLVIGNTNGGFYIAKKNERKVAVQLSYQEEYNVHILEVAMRTFWKRPSAKISDMLKQEE